MPMEYTNKISTYKLPRCTSHKTSSPSNRSGSTCRSDDSGIGIEEEVSSSADLLCRGNMGAQTPSQSDSRLFNRVNGIKCPSLLLRQLERVEKSKPWDHVHDQDAILFTRSMVSGAKALGNKKDGGYERVGWRPSTVPNAEADDKGVGGITLAKLQGGGQVKWKPTEKKRPHHSSSIQLPAVYETWKEPSRVNRRRTQAAAAAAAEARRSSRSVPTLSRRNKTESPERVSNSAPSSKPLPSNHDRHNSDLTSSKKTVTQSRLPKINTLVAGAPESNSSADSPTQKQKHSKPKDIGHKTTSPLSPKEQKANDVSVQPKGDRLKGEENNNVLPKVGKETTQSRKLPSENKPHLDKKDNVISVPKDGPSVRLKASNPNERKTEEKDGKVLSKSLTKEGTEDHHRTNRTKDDYIVNISDKSEQILNKLPKRTTERTKSEKKPTTLSHNSVVQARQNKTKHKSNDEIKTRTIKNDSVIDEPRVQPQTLTKQRLVDVNSPTKAPPSRATHSRIGTGFSSRVNPRSRSNQFRSKPPLQRRQTKTGFFTSSGEFVTNDEEGKQSEVSVETSRTKRTDASTATLKSNVSGSTTSTSAISTTSSGTARKPLRRRQVIITKKTLTRQKFYNSVYNNQHYKIQRQTAFLKKVENAQVKIDDEKNREYMDTKKKKYESVVRQYQTLKQIRDKFDEEQVKRFSRQYVSWRSIEEDRLNRQSTRYGLPDNIYEDRYDKTLKEVPKLTKPKSKSNMKDKKFSRFARWVQNIRRFERILKPNIGAGLEDSMLRSTKGALVEGKDIVELHQSRDESSEQGGQGPLRTKKIVKVRNVIGSAKRLLQATQDMDAISEVSDENDDGGDDDFSDVSSLDLSDDDDYRTK